ncbi:agmatinase [Bosea sp. (in: a-proteobacteria)]|uniref:agmatinase n=1 Tax=Bosea sp. (in: a-proteobacteria) TaxID=1871050 RepID=UPI00262019B3|nr:agmatinase [Bosea sp. (in: a-proteobacteria)]MCO5091307.1 agmatinase [Bosea sp. (in: a-proteobacteria)]
MTAESEIQRLRAKYGSEAGSNFYDPLFRQVAEEQFKGDQRKLPYSGFSTFFDLPLLERGIEAPEFCDLDIAVLGVPMDLGVTNRAGCRLGPRAVRQIERIGPFEHGLGVAPMMIANAADIGDVPFRSRFDLESCHQDIQAHLQAVVDAGVVPLSVGGDHSITQSILRVVGRERPVGLVHIDAHCDTSGPYEGSRFHHGGPFRQAVLDGTIDPRRTIQIGIRGGAEYLWEFSRDAGMTVIHADAFLSMGVDRIVAAARDVVGTGPTYLSFDIDSLDPAFAPGTGTPEIGGLSSLQALSLLRGLGGVDFVGGDLVEVSPAYDATTNTAQAGAQVLFTIFSLLAVAAQARARASAGKGP